MISVAEERHRRSIRLPGYDYAQPGAYFITVVTAGRQSIFGRIVDAEMHASRVGDIVRYEWHDLPRHFPFLELGAFVVMPNHIHGILVIRPRVGATRLGPNTALESNGTFPPTDVDSPEGSPLQGQRPTGPRCKSLGAIVGQFKSRVTRRIWKLPHMHLVPLWQRNYYEHVIRDQREWERIHLYIESNPVNWSQDEENPSNFF